jgi:hypothetical protein
MRHFLTLAALLTASMLGACGTRGGLILPPGPAPAPIFGNPAPAKPAPKPATPDTTEPAAGGDLNTATEAQK